MASVTMSTSVALPEVRHKHHVGTFEPSTELLEKLRAILVSSPPREPARTPSTLKDYYDQLPFHPEQRRPESMNYGPWTETAYSSDIPRSEPRDIVALKTHRSPKHSSKGTRTRQSISSGSHEMTHLAHTHELPGEREGYTTTFKSTITLASLINNSPRMSSEDADSYFKHAVLGLECLHRSGISHQDLRPENLIITINNVLMISNFERPNPSSNGGMVTRRKDSASSAEYIAPEVFLSSTYDARAVDMWAIGLIYMEMRRGKLLWSVAAEGADDLYDRYLQDRVSMWGYRPIENLSNEHCRRVITSLLDPIAERRYTASRVLKSSWCNAIRLSIPAIN